LPPICYHLGIAEEVISRLHHPMVKSQRGSFFLGSTAPDIRFFLGAKREETHFLPLDCEEGASGVNYMLEAHPGLVDGEGLNPATRSFIAGYISHLATDEAWIYLIYRPFFGKSSPLGGDPMANLFDRLLQFEIDRRERLNSMSMSAIRKELTASDSGVGVSFIDAFNLSRWREFVIIATTRRPNWEQFRSFAERYLIWMRQIAPARLDDFFASFDARVEQVLEMVPEEKIQEFREQSIVDSVKTAREYLG
jgi:hypothetical protein